VFLHNDEKRFVEIVADTSVVQKIEVALIEKDYFITLFLKYLSETEPLLVFKGGTCLSKCF
jgi:predicted nucleotidyltransferase component of viral defense system